MNPQSPVSNFVGSFFSGECVSNSGNGSLAGVMAAE